jgi:hypothetical protein
VVGQLIFAEYGDDDVALVQTLLDALSIYTAATEQPSGRMRRHTLARSLR